MKMSTSKDVAKNGKCIYLYVIEKKSIKDYVDISMPKPYTGSIRDESKMGYTVLAKALLNRFGITYQPEEISVAQKGKPYINNHTIHFNLSNCRDYIACAIANEEVGVDIEHARPIKPKLLEKILTPQEIKDAVDPLRAWVIKEAYSKFLGSGIGLGFAKLSAESLQGKYPNILLDEESFICSLFYVNPDTHVQLQYTLGGDN